MTTNQQHIHSDVYSFTNNWGIEPIPGMVLEMLDKSNYEVYDCVVTRLDDRGIWIKRDNETSEQLADMACLQIPGEALEDWIDIED